MATLRSGKLRCSHPYSSDPLMTIFSYSMEIGSAYALQVCLLQIPAMVAFSAFYDPGRLGEMVDTFT
jgi:hypothetical protein